MSKEHERIREQLSAHLDGQLPGAQAEEVEKALRGEANLARELAGMQAVRAMVRQLPRESAPPNLVGKVLARAERSRPRARDALAPARAAGWRLGRLATAAVVLLAVGLGAGVVAWVSSPAYLGQRGDVVRHDRSANGVLALKPSGERPGKAGGETAARKGWSDGLAVNQPDAEVTNYFINTDNVVLAQQQVEQVFASNDIALVDEKGGADVRPPAETHALGKVAGQSQPPPGQVRYEVVLDEPHRQRIVEQLNGIRANAKVEQVPTRDRNSQMTNWDFAAKTGPSEPNVAHEGKDNMVSRPFKPGMVISEAAKLSQPSTRPAASGKVSDDAQVAGAGTARPGEPPAASPAAPARPGEQDNKVQNEMAQRGYSKVGQAPPNQATNVAFRRTDGYPYSQRQVQSGTLGVNETAQSQPLARNLLNVKDAPVVQQAQTNVATANNKQLVIIINASYSSARE